MLEYDVIQPFKDLASCDDVNCFSFSGFWTNMGIDLTVNWKTTADYREARRSKTSAPCEEAGFASESVSREK